jgi:signal transduction histidine kinase
MEATPEKPRVRRNKLQLLDSAAPQFESFMESREQYIRALEETIDLLKRDQVAATEANLAIRSSISELMAMQQLSNAISTANDPETIVGTLIHLTRQVISVVESNVFLFVRQDSFGERKTNSLLPLSKKSSEKFNAEALQHVEAGIVDWVIAEQRTVIFPDLDAISAKGKKQIIVIVPLVLRNEALGMYMLRSTKSHEEVSNHDIQLLTVLANQATIGIENWRAYEQLVAVNKELKASQAQMTQAAKLAAIGELAASIVHEIKNPVQVLMMHMEMVQRGKSLPNWMELLGQQVKRLSEITRRLMSFSHSVGDDIPFEEVNVHQPISDTIAIVRHDYQNHNIEIICHLHNDLPLIYGNVNALQQVFLNLLLNARDAMPNGGSITITTESSGYYVLVRFTDTGVGIEKELLGKIFMPFFTTKAEGTGTGLGLSICRKIISEHKGEIKVESVIGKGTTFSIFLPIRRRVQ